MRFSQSIQILVSLGLLVSGSVIPRDTIDPDNPEASNPKTPPKKLNRPPRPDNPFKAGFKNAPPSCTDFRKPSQQCITDLQAQPGGVNTFSGGELKWDNNHNCNDRQQGMYQTAAWDAHALAFFADQEPDPHSSKDITLWKTWIGPDYPTQQKRISENFKRAGQFLTQKTFDILLSCSDPQTLCPVRKDGKSVGGYAWNYDGWFGYKYYYINMCEPFFLTDDLMYKIDQMEDELAKGNTQKAREAVWQKNTGQMFLHEMMHLNSVGQPHVGDEHVDPNDAQNWAYGPARVHMLARRKLNQGGGATRASTNADSYVWLANSKYWYSLTDLSAEQWEQDQNGWNLDFGTITETTSDTDFKARLNGIVDGFGIPSLKPDTGKSLSIAMVSSVNSHSDWASIDSTWSFYTTRVGKAVGSCGETDGQKLALSGGTDPKLSSNANIDNPPWPAGEFKLNIEGEECEYKCDGTNPGRLFCPKKQITCKEDTMKSNKEGTLKCGSSVTFHPAVYCDF